MKKIILFFTISVFLFQVKPVFAVELNHAVGLGNPVSTAKNFENRQLATVSAPSERLTPPLQKLKDFKGATPSANKVDNLKERADREIQRRIEDLNRLITKINGLKKITDAQKSDFVNQVQAEITNLNTLKTKIDADTDLVTLKTDVQSIIKSYRIYLLFIPKINVLVAADSLDALSGKLSSLAAKLELRLNSSTDPNTTTLKATLADMKTKIADIGVQAQNARNVVLPLTPDGYPGNKTQLEQARQFIVAGKKDALVARQDAGLIVQTLGGTHKDKTASESGEHKPLKPEGNHPIGLPPISPESHE
jgi:hypothetical protein